MTSSFVEAENLTREQCVFLARLAEQTDRYHDMLEFTTKLVRSITPPMELTVEERNLVYTSFKKVIGSHRAAWRIVSAIERKEMSRGDEDATMMVMAYKSTIESRLSQECNNVLGLLESNLIPSATTNDSMVFYLKMKGDYHRYIAEVKNGYEREEAANNTLTSYESALKIARVDLAPVDPIRLGLLLNFSVFCYEILNQRDKAIEMAKQTYEEANIEFDTLEEETNKESTLIMQFLRDNLTIWTPDHYFQDQNDIN